MESKNKIPFSAAAGKSIGIYAWKVGGDNYQVFTDDRSAAMEEKKDLESRGYTVRVIMNGKEIHDSDFIADDDKIIDTLVNMEGDEIDLIGTQKNPFGFTIIKFESGKEKTFNSYTAAVSYAEKRGYWF